MLGVCHSARNSSACSKTHLHHCLFPFSHKRGYQVRVQETPQKKQKKSVWYVCNAGLACGGAHNRAELRAEAAVVHEKQTESYRFALCENWYRRGTCSRDVGCEFAHGIDEVR